MIFIAQYQQTSPEAAVIGAALDAGIQDTSRGMVSSIPPTFPTHFADRARSRIVVWMEKELFIVERLEMSGTARGTVDNSAAERLEMSAPLGCVDNSAAIVQGLEMSSSSHGTVDNSAAECLEMPCPSPGALDNSAVVDTRLSDRLTGDGRGCVALSTGPILGWILNEGRVPVAENHGCGYCNTIVHGIGTLEIPAPTSSALNEAAEAINGKKCCEAPDLAAGVDTGPGSTEGAFLSPHSVKTGQNCVAMPDWNELLEFEDQLGPLPSFGTSQIIQKVLECIRRNSALYSNN
ncbi:hypothetical protein B0H13DRAFT_1899101 [Mycena leptocephala]|nr:hypothetical protein B0H13DRAFT_1899101 [Mycena leptocephala]